MNTEIFELGKA